MAKSVNQQPSKAEGEVIWGVRFGARQARPDVAVATVDFGSGWYHEAAVREAGQPKPAPSDGRKPH